MVTKPLLLTLLVCFYWITKAYVCVIIGQPQKCCEEKSCQKGIHGLSRAGVVHWSEEREVQLYTLTELSHEALAIQETIFIVTVGKKSMENCL